MNGVMRLFLDMLEASRDEGVVKEALDNFANAFGYDRFAYLQTEGIEVKTFNNYPEAWQELYLANDYARIDPVVTEAKRRRDTFSWTAEDWSFVGASELRRFRDEAVRHGIRSGITIPSEGAFGSTIMLTFASKRKAAGLAETLDPKSAMTVLLAVHYRLQMIASTMLVMPKRLLSPRENICMKWASKGKNAAETAVLTGINPRTVQHYLDSARAKLAARTLPQLVAIAKDHGLL